MHRLQRDLGGECEISFETPNQQRQPSVPARLCSCHGNNLLLESELPYLFAIPNYVSLVCRLGCVLVVAIIFS